MRVRSDRDGVAPEPARGDLSVIDLAALFEQHSDEFLKLDRIENPRHPRSDVCAFLLLHELAPVPPTLSDGVMVRRLVSAAEHDEIWLDVDLQVLAENATEVDVLTLIRCGVRYSASEHALCMFV